MPSPITIVIKSEPVLNRFLVSTFGKMPIEFPKGHFLLDKLMFFLRRPPMDHNLKAREENDLVIVLPYNAEKNILYNFYLGPSCEEIYLRILRRFFHVAFIEDMNESRLAGLNIKDSIIVFIDKHNLGEDAFDALNKYHQRYSLCKRVHKHRKKNGKISSVKRANCPLM